MEKKYQVFLSSTYKDLQHERQLAIAEILKADCIPVGMELFPASHDDPLAYIRRVIDDSDYYLIIIGGRYGSEYNGKSFTQHEFEYAMQKQKKIVAFVHSDPLSLPPEKRDTQEKLKKLSILRKNLERDKLVVHWEKSDQLPEKILHSLVRLQKDHGAEGWVRASADNFRMIAERGHEALVKRIEKLKVTLARRKKTESKLPKGIRNQQQKLSMLVKQRLREIDSKAEALFGANIVSSRTKTPMPFSASKIADSLSQLGIPMHVSCEVVERCVEELETIHRTSDLLTTADIRRAISESLYRLEPDGIPLKRIHLWVDNYIRVYGNPDRQILIVDDTGCLGERLMPLTFPLIQRYVLSDIFKVIFPTDHPQRIAAIRRQDRDAFSDEVMKHVKSTDRFRLHYTTVVALAKDLALSPPHPWLVRDEDLDWATEYDLQRARNHAERLREVLRGPDLPADHHSLRECLHHSCSGMLVMYRVVPGCGYLSPLYNLYHHLSEYLRNGLSQDLSYSDFAELPQDLDRQAVSINALVNDLNVAQKQASAVESVGIENFQELAKLALRLAELLEQLVSHKRPQVLAAIFG